MLVPAPSAEEIPLVELPTDVEFSVGGEVPELDPVIELGPGDEITVTDPNATLAPAAPAPPFDANLADFMQESDLHALGAEVVQLFKDDLEARSEWEKGYVDALKLLGTSYEERSEPWPGASGVTHPLLLEALIRFQASTMAETFPATGPCKSKIFGKVTKEKEDTAYRKVEHMNWQLTERMKEYRTEHAKTLWGMGLAGEAFKKVFRDPISRRPTSRFVPAFDMVRAYGTSDLSTCPRYTHSFMVDKASLQRMQKSGFYRDIKLDDPVEERTEVEEAEDKVKGVDVTSSANDKGRFRLLEQHADINLKGFEDPSGTPLPYIVTVDFQTNKVLAIRRNWEESDPLKIKREHFVFYPMVIGTDGFGLGYAHTIGQLARTATGTQRQLIDAGTFNNIPGGFRAKGFRTKDDEFRVKPGHFVQVDVPNGKISECIVPYSTKEPSATLLALHEKAVEDGRRVASIQDIPVGQGSQEAPVGTTIALLEDRKIPQTAVAANVHAAMKQEFKLLAALIAEDPPAYPYDTGADPAIKAQDFASDVDVVPVSDPNASSRAQRVIMGQALAQAAQQAPGTFNIPEVAKEFVTNLGYQDPERFVNVPEEVVPMDPITESMNIMTGKPVKAGIDQDHDSHIAVLLAMKNDPKIQQTFQQENPQALAALNAHLYEHVAFKYRAEIQKMMGIELPPPGQPMPPEIEGPYSKLVAQAAEKLLQKDIGEQQLMEDIAKRQDPVFQQQEKELAIKAEANQIKIFEAKLDALTDMLATMQKAASDEAKMAIQANMKAVDLVANDYASDKANMHAKEMADKKDASSKGSDAGS